jgi:hypothetical protein
MMLFLACNASEPVVEPAYVRDGFLKKAASGWELQSGPWPEGAPLQAECIPLFHVPMEDMSRLASSGAPPPDTALAFSPDGTQLAIGSFGGWLRVVDGWSGKLLAEKKLAEGLVKEVAWSPDGATLYIGEQSPDALVVALDPASLEQRWSFRLADDLEQSPLPAEDDIYGPYSLPGVYSLKVLKNGELVVAGAHGWSPAEGVRKNRSRLYHLSSEGKFLKGWPESGAADAVLLHPVVTDDLLLTSISRSASGPPPADLPIGGVALFDTATLSLKWSRQFPVLAPLFKDVFIWEGLGLGKNTVLAGLGDGRAFLLDESGQEKAALTPGVPIQAAGVPISCGVGFGSIYAGDPDSVYFLTTGTNIPFGSADPMARPPSAHPAQNTVHAVDANGKALWSRQLAQSATGIAISPDGAELTVAAGGRLTDTRTDLFGAVVLDRASGTVRTSCSTSGPAHFRVAYGPDGRRLAVSESPFFQEGVVQGRYQVTVFR